MALGVALPVLVLSQAMPLVHAWRERLLIDEQVRFIETQLTTALIGSLQHAMLSNDRAMMSDTLKHMVSADGIQRIRVLNLAGEVAVDASLADANAVKTTVDGGCIACHARAADRRGTAMTLSMSGGVMRFVSPIDNQPACAACHDPVAPHLGVLLTEVSTGITWASLMSILGKDGAPAMLPRGEKANPTNSREIATLTVSTNRCVIALLTFPSRALKRSSVVVPQNHE
jgi:hypothetical protein